MKSSSILLILCSLTLTGACTARWSETAPNGAHISQAEPLCRAEARRSALRQLPFHHDRYAGAAGFPPDSRWDIEERETALCLQNQGFRLIRE